MPARTRMSLSGMTRAMAKNARERDGRRIKGFTLVELLVVVSIICLMMSLLLPSLNRAQKQAEQVHCLANQRQLYLAWALYSTNNDDCLCVPYAYRTALAPYAPQKDVFYCKTVAPQGVRQYGHGSSYGVSNTMGGEFRDGVHPHERFHKITQVSDSMVFADAETGGCFWPLLRDSEQKKWLWRPPDMLGLAGVTLRHGNGCNMTFADGHGEMIHWKDQRTLGLIKGTLVDEVEASANNADLDYLVRVLVGDRPVQDKTEEQKEK
jgi:prepilin-type N-terminal cleavage/methylation domain-containing protein/prepilin-type processing-associated H-X9-DG protein